MNIVEPYWHGVRQNSIPWVKPSMLPHSPLAYTVRHFHTSRHSINQQQQQTSPPAVDTLTFAPPPPPREDNVRMVGSGWIERNGMDFVFTSEVRLFVCLVWSLQVPTLPYFPVPIHKTQNIFIDRCCKPLDLDSRLRPSSCIRSAKQATLPRANCHFTALFLRFCLFLFRDGERWWRQWKRWSGHFVRSDLQ